MELVIRDQTFEANDTLPAWAMLKLAKGQQSKNPMVQAASLHDVILAMVKANERERFEAYMAEVDVGFDELNEAVGTLVAAYNDRPTERPSRSQPGAQATGKPSRVVSLSRGTESTDAASSTDGTAAAS